MAENTQDTFFDDSGESQDQEDKNIRKAALKANLKKGGVNIAILLVGAIGLGAYAFLSGDDSDSADADGSSANVVNRGGQGDVRETELSEDSPIAQRQAEARQQQEEQAQSTGSTYMEQIERRNEERAEQQNIDTASNPKKTTGDLALESIATQSSRTTPVPPVSRPTNGNQPGNGKPEGWTLKDEIDEAKGYASQVSDDLKRIAQAQSEYGSYGAFAAVSTSDSENGADDGSTDSDVPFVAGGYGESLTFDQNPSGQTPRTFKVPPDTRLFGVATVGHDSDVGGPMSFESVTPPLDGAVFIAEDVPLQGKAVTPQVTRMIYRGTSYDVRALIVNAETFQPGLASDVDNHYLSRWVPYLAGVFGGAYAESLTDQTTTTTPEGATVNEESGVPNANDQIAYTVGTGLGRVVPILQEQINRPVTVTVDNGEEVGIWILSEIEVKR
jgi:hypothetical protein